MNEKTLRHSVLALIGLASLTIYILACASFSPDDSKIAYPSFDPASGDLGVAVYDRKSGHSEMVFLPRFYDGNAARREPRALRPQWLPDGAGLLVAWSGDGSSKDNGLNLAVLPWPNRGLTRLIGLPELSDMAQRLSRPIPIVGSQVFLVGESNVMIRVDLATGEMVTHPAKSEILLLPDGAGSRVFYLAKDPDNEDQLEFGRLEPKTFSQAALARFSDVDFKEDEGGPLTIGPDGKKLAFARQSDGKCALVVKESGTPELKFPLNSGRERLNLGYAQFSPKGDLIYVAFRSEPEGEGDAQLGFLEVPLGGGKVRRTTLLNTPGHGRSEDVLYFQIGLSHDGKMLAVSSTYLAVDKNDLKPADCALFLVDLSSPDRKVTKVPIPMPKRKE